LDKPLNLRAGDALHLAVAKRLNAAVATLDLRMGAAAEGLKIERVDLI
jgi:predicted nucleic acid-binding protein